MKTSTQRETPPISGLARAATADSALGSLCAGPHATPREAELYVRYVRALALLCECAPYVDEPDYLELIDALLDDAQASYPLEVRKGSTERALAPRGARDG